MKIKVFFLCLLINVSFTFAEELHLFRFKSLSDFVDVFTGNDLPVYESYMNILNRQNIKQQKVFLVRDNRKEYFERNYSREGFLVSEISHVHDKNQYFYVYDDNNNIIKCGDFTYKYLDSATREVYFRNELQKKESFIVSNDKVNITVIYYSFTTSDNSLFESSKRFYEYQLQGKKIKKFTSENYNRLGKLSFNPREIIFEYNEQGNILQIIDSYGSDDIRSVRNFLYKDDQLVEIRIENFTKGNPNSIITFSEFDKNGNYLLYKEVWSSGKIVSARREFQYY